MNYLIKTIALIKKIKKSKKHTNCKEILTKNIRKYFHFTLYHNIYLTFSDKYFKALIHNAFYAIHKKKGEIHMMDKNNILEYKKDQSIIEQNKAASAVSIILRGGADFYFSTSTCSYRLFKSEQNLFLGYNEIISQKPCAFDVRANSDCSVYSLNACCENDVVNILQKHKEYGAYFVSSSTWLMQNIYSFLTKVSELLTKIRIFADNACLLFNYLKNSHGAEIKCESIYLKKFLESIDSSDYTIVNPVQFMHSNREFPDEIRNNSYFEQFHPEQKMYDHPKMQYYLQISKFPLDIRKSFFGENTYVTCFNLKEQIEILDDLEEQLISFLFSLETIIKQIYNDSSPCIFKDFISLALSYGNSNYDDMYESILSMFIDTIEEIQYTLFNEFNVKTSFDISYMKNLCAQIKINHMKDVEVKKSFDSVLPEELKNSFAKLLEFSEINETSGRELAACFNALKSNKLSQDERSDAKKYFIGHFFDLYERIALKCIKNASKNRLIDMFLNFGYIDEEMLDIKNILEIYKLNDENIVCEPCRVFFAKDWLEKIYFFKKTPSINEFGEEYQEYLRNLKKRKQISENEEAALEKNPEERVKYEIRNMFKINHKLCHGHSSSYFPAIYENMFNKSPQNAFLSSEKLNLAVKKVNDIDFSLFHREIFYSNPSRNIEKEIIMKAFAPDIILLPIYGSRAIMWQDITGRVRGSSGRFVFPVFTDENVNAMMIKLLANFRWELCRTMMGVVWNDITQRSLTSEYTDYIQFYKKNRDLSLEAREKVKNEIQKHRGVTKDIFAADYEIWINYESAGMCRLNKVARSILFNHCPLNKNIRESLSKHQMFSELAQKFNRQRQKTMKELESRYSRYIKNNGCLDEALLDNLNFYKEL